MQKNAKNKKGFFKYILFNFSPAKMPGAPGPSRAAPPDVARTRMGI